MVTPEKEHPLSGSYTPPVNTQHEHPNKQLTEQEAIAQEEEVLSHKKEGLLCRESLYLAIGFLYSKMELQTRPQGDSKELVSKM